MIIRLGYVAMTLNLEECSPSKTVTATVYNKIDNEEGKKNRLRRITKENLQNTLRILYYNTAHDIDVYRLTSKLVPLATLPGISDWDYAADFADEFKEIGDYVKENQLRVSAHPDHFTLINSKEEKVLADSVRDLEYHYKVYEAMGLEDSRYKLILHVGGLYKDKASSMRRFVENYKNLPDYLRNRIILENDDKSFNAADVLGICNEINIPMVLDVHHFKCNNEGEDLGKMLPAIFDTWNGQFFKPKIHFSSPKSEKDFRSHADYINTDDFLAFLELAKETDRDFDVMLEAKSKDNALFELMDGLKKWNKCKILNDSTIEY